MRSAENRRGGVRRSRDAAFRPVMQLEDLIPIHEVARLLGYRGTSSVRMLVQRGDLEVVARGGRNRAFFLRADVLALVQRRAAIYGRQRSGEGATK